MSAIDIEKLRKLAKEYRATMDKDVLHSWASDVAVALPALLDRVEAGEWQPIETVAYLQPVRVKVGDMTFLATLQPLVSMSDLETPCDQWQAINEGEHPRCWSGGSCWESNEDGDCSLQPEAWQHIQQKADTP